MATSTKVKRVRFIFYTGIGSNKTGRHTKDAFLKIMYKHFLSDPTISQEERDLMKKYKLRDWLSFSGAQLRYQRIIVS